MHLPGASNTAMPLQLAHLGAPAGRELRNNAPLAHHLSDLSAAGAEEAHEGPSGARLPRASFRHVVRRSGYGQSRGYCRRIGYDD
jgi:hypothetical protein